MDTQYKIKQLEKMLKKSKEIKVEDSSDPSFISWNTLVERNLIKIFGNNSLEHNSFKKLHFCYYGIMVGGIDYSSNHLRVFKRDLETTIKMIESYIEEFTEEIEEKKEDFNIGSLSDTEISETSLSENIFIVHGHDNGMKETVARVIEKMKLTPIILHEQANRGRTVIQKFSDNSNVSFSIVLLSPDDIAYSKDAKPESSKYRARQNVIFEMGFFMGKLGFNRVIALYNKSEDFELPSDYEGVIYVPFDTSGAWETTLVRELKEIGYDVTADDIL
jgi:predicted nucleotide-binding protein